LFGALPADELSFQTVDLNGTPVAVGTAGATGPTIIFEAGQGEGIDSWKSVTGPLTPCARVIVYDRPGIGRSGPGRRTVLTAGVVASDLKLLLGKLHAVPPYILVGHSLGALYVQAFARTYPGQIAGVVLVDGSSPLEPDGVFVSSAQAKPGTAAAAEEAGVSPSMVAIRHGPNFPPVPLIVLIAADHGDTPAREKLWRDIQEHTAALSPKGQTRLVENSGHFIQLDQPQAVLNAIQTVAEMSSHPLSCLKP
jgi:pimeloyl-ACP methyl ester carboxylesterase